MLSLLSPPLVQPTPVTMQLSLIVMYMHAAVAATKSLSPV